MNDKYEAVIGLEVHAQLLTKTKLFSGDSTTFGAAPNTHVSPVSLGHPGTLPVMNKEVLRLAVKLGLALNCTVEQQNYFARKNYFYPDLPKGYQVSQHSAPICNGGFLRIETDGVLKNVRLNRIHMEEDAGKSLHDLFSESTGIDLNRAGTPLLEIVTEPDLHSAAEAYNYVTELRRLLRWLGVCDGNMEEGSLRCDANVSVRLRGEKTLGTRVEVKNLNSIRNVKKAIEIEIDRLITVCESGEKVIQQTRSFNADNNTTFSLRSKEEAEDYRYFPEPDLPPFNLSADFLAEIGKEIPELPAVLEQKYRQEYGLSAYDAAAICADREEAAFYESLAKSCGNYKAAANWLTGPLRSYCTRNNMSIRSFPLSPAAIGSLVTLTESGRVHFNTAGSKLLEAMIAAPGKAAEEVAGSLGLLQQNDNAQLSDWVKEALAEMPDKVKEYKAGKKGLIGLFAGRVKKLSKGQADMQVVNMLLEEALQ